MLEDLEKELRAREATHLQALEGNPLDADQLAMFEMFDREGWSQERRLEHLRARVTAAASASNSE